MNLTLAVRAVTVWLALLALAVGNGLFREAVLVPTLGTAPGTFLSGVILCGLVLALAYVSLPWFGSSTAFRLLLIGLAWLVLTLLFEFSFALLRGQTTAEILEAYRFRNGNIWPAVLVVITLSPWLGARLRG